MALSLSYLQATTNTSNLSTYTFSGVNLGTADADRYIIVGISSRIAGSTPQTITSVTIGGVTATITEQVTHSVTNTDISGLVIAKVPTGATGNIVVNFSATMLRCAIVIYRATGITGVTAYDSGNSVANDPTFALDIPSSGFAVGTAMTNAATVTAWTGITEDADGTLESYVTYSSASDTFSSLETGRTLLANFTAPGGESAGCFASWEESSATTTSTSSTTTTTSTSSTTSTTTTSTSTSSTTSTSTTTTSTSTTTSTTTTSTSSTTSTTTTSTSSTTSTTTTSTSSTTSTTTTSTSTSTSSTTSTSTTTTIDPNSGGNAFGEQTPTGEVAVSWQTFTDGSGSVPTISGDADWGKMLLNDGKEGRSLVYSFGNSQSRVITLIENKYGAGSDQGAILQIRGHDSIIFLQDDVTPTWENYTVPIAKTWKYIQVRLSN